MALAQALVPQWQTIRPNYEKADAGLPLVPNAKHTIVFEATPESGTYSHGAQIERHDGAFHVAWNNAAFNEDADGMRILYASSTDGQTWSQPVDLFPSMPASQFGTPGQPPWKIHHRTAPFVTLHGRLYAVSSLGDFGAAFEIYPVPSYDLNSTLLRRVIHPPKLYPACPGTDPPDWCRGTMRWTRPALGPLFWATNEVPRGFENVTISFGIRTAQEASQEESQTLTLILSE